MYLAYPSEDRNPNQAWWDQNYQSAVYNTNNIAPGETIADSTYVACAVNTRGQQRYQYGNYNGYCYSGLAYVTAGGYIRPGVVS